MDNDRTWQISPSPMTRLSVAFDETLLGGVATIQGDAYRPTVQGWHGTLYAPRERETYEKVPFQAIPYCLWANRTAGEMRVWLRCTCRRHQRKRW
ncbi:MAG: hypothetical protein R3E79_61425 [Caldilineaceae bacterium]